MAIEVTLDVDRGINVAQVPNSAPPSATARAARMPSQEVSRAWEYHELHMLRREVNHLRRNIKSDSPQRAKLESCIAFAIIIVLITIALALIVSYRGK